VDINRKNQTYESNLILCIFFFVNSTMNILLIEPYWTGSHAQWAEGFAKHSRHDVRFLNLKGQFWKWRMHGGAVTLARKFNAMDWRPDLILATDMLDLTSFLALTKNKFHGIPTAIYFHENQISYPWSPTDRDIQNKRDSHYGFINFTSALAADTVFFNSEFHMDSFLQALPPFLRQFPDHQELDAVDLIQAKSRLLHLGLDLQKFDVHKTSHGNTPLILWNHRWEYDKNPDSFFSVLRKVKEDGFDFQLAVLGENFSQFPEIFLEAEKLFESQIVQWGFSDSFADYAHWLWKADIIPVTSNQEFFGASVMEAMYCDTWPLLPNRLTYPELLSPDQHGEHLYENEDDLKRKLIEAIQNIDQVRATHFHPIAKPFDWESMVKMYDNAMEQV
jgi:glycosyltransferase involved in cell wall biosynthesis